MSLYFPNEILTDILLRLSVKSLLQISCVCKSWRSLVADPDFIKMHLSRNNNNTSELILCRDSKIYSLQHDIPSPLAVEINSPEYMEASGVIGSLNGLLCILHINHDITISNPSIKGFVKVPPPDSEWESRDLEEYGVESDDIYGFGYDFRNNVYKIVKIVQYVNWNTELYLRSEVEVYIVGTDSWRRIENMYFFICGEPGLSVKGSLNWLLYRGGVDGSLCIVSFDLSLEKFSEIQIPNPDSVGSVTHLGNLGGNLCLLTQSNDTQADVWMLKDYGLKESWAKLFTIPELPGYQPLYLRVLGYSQTGKVILQHDLSHLLLYDPKMETFEIVHIRGAPNRFTTKIYTRSILSINSAVFQSLQRDNEGAEVGSCWVQMNWSL